MRELPVVQFTALLEQVTGEFQQFLQAMELANTDAFESALEQVIEAFTLKVGDVLEADRVTLFLVDEERGELWSKVARGEGERALDIRIPLASGIAGRVAAHRAGGQHARRPHRPGLQRRRRRAHGLPHAEPAQRPHPQPPGPVFAVAQVVNRQGAEQFDAADERRLCEFANSIGVILESWWRMSRRSHRRPWSLGVGRSGPGGFSARVGSPCGRGEHGSASGV